MQSADSDIEMLGRQLQAMTAAVVGEPSISAPDLRTALRFINRVIEVVDQAFGEVYAVLVEVSMLEDDDLLDGRVREVRRSIELLSMRSRYRDAEEICSRLHHLADEYGKSIAPIVAPVVNERSWSQVFMLLDGYEGRIMGLVHDSTERLSVMLERVSPGSLPEIRDEAKAQKRVIKEALETLIILRNKILGLSGEAGLMQLMYSDNRTAAAALLSIQELKMGDTYNVQGAGAVGPGAASHNTTINQAWYQLQDHDTGKLASELSALRIALKARATEPVHDLATAEVASAQIAAEKGDGPGALQFLARAGKWALGVATTIGTPLAAAALKAALGL